MIDKDKLEELTAFATTRHPSVQKVQIHTEDLIALCGDAAMLRRLTVDVNARERPVYLNDLDGDSPTEDVVTIAGPILSRLRGGL